MEPISKEKFHKTVKTCEYYAYRVKSNCQEFFSFKNYFEIIISVF